MYHKNSNDHFSHPPHNDQNIFSSPRTIIALYTSLRILIKMKRELGLEAMMEYLDKNIVNLEKDNIQMKRAVTKALIFINTKKIYEEAMSKK